MTGDSCVGPETVPPCEWFSAAVFTTCDAENCSHLAGTYGRRQKWSIIYILPAGPASQTELKKGFRRPSSTNCHRRRWSSPHQCGQLGCWCWCWQRARSRSQTLLHRGSTHTGSDHQPSYPTLTCGRSMNSSTRTTRDHVTVTRSTTTKARVSFCMATVVPDSSSILSSSPWRDSCVASWRPRPRSLQIILDQLSCGAYIGVCEARKSLLAWSLTSDGLGEDGTTMTPGIFNKYSYLKDKLSLVPSHFLYRLQLHLWEFCLWYKFVVLNVCYFIKYLLQYVCQPCVKIITMNIWIYAWGLNKN